MSIRDNILSVRNSSNIWPATDLQNNNIDENNIDEFSNPYIETNNVQTKIDTKFEQFSN